ncbi:MAG: hypothetical protein IT373_25420 [Polyangiaceae bacterium]|nr:hypothetical protein [Polyangiaceae bacterium]
MVCWGFDFYGITGLLGGSYVDLAMNRYNACAVRSDGSVHCWGDGAADPNNGHLFPPSDIAFVDVEIGSDIGCGLTTDTRLVCW